MLRSRQNMPFRCHLSRSKAHADPSQETLGFNPHLATVRIVLSLFARLEVLALLTLVPVCAAQTDAKPQKSILSFGGTDRTYSLFVPSGLVTPSPLLLLLHGSGQDSEALIETWQEIAQKEGIILVAPDSIDPAAWDPLEDSPDLLHAIVASVKANHPVDDHRLYLFGSSAGGAYALYLSIVESEYFAATAIQSGALLASNFRLIGAAKRKIPISIWSAVDDPSAPLAQARATR